MKMKQKEENQAPTSTAEWVLLTKWCERTGDTAHAVHARRKRGEWLDGVQCILGANNRLWVNYQEAQQWVSNNR